MTIKATSEIELYLNDEELMAGVVMYRAGETYFQRDTVVQPDNLFMVNHRELRDPRCVIGTLPVDFHGRLVHAIKASIRIDRKRQAKLLELLGER